jgi:2'-5' RNA ligase
MSNVRLFTGLSLPPDIIANLEALLCELRPLAPRIRWSPAANLHITTKFIGAWPFSRLPELSRLLYDGHLSGAVPVSISGIGFFRGPHRSRVLFAGVEESARLRELASQTETLLEILNIPREKRDYRPHLTLARIPGPTPWPALDEKVATLSDKKLGSFEATEYHLYESVSSVYKKLATIPVK